MIFSRALLKELTATGAAVFMALFSIVLTTGLIRILGMAAGGEIGSDAVVAVLAFSVLNYLPILLSLTVYIATLTTVSRSYRDSEMVVWFSAGQSLLAWIPPVLKFALPVAAVAFALSIWVTPWANQRSNEYRARYEQRSDLARVSPGQFAESGRSDRVFFVESVAADARQVKNIFISAFEQGKLSIAFSAQGHTEVEDDGSKYVVLEHGRRYDGKPGAADYKIIEFEGYRALIQDKGAPIRAEKSVREIPTATLISTPTAQHLGELLWRLAVPLFGITLVLLALPLSFVNPRAGRSFNLVIALLLYVIYTNTTSIFQGFVIQGKWTFASAWWPPHLVLLTITAIWFARRLSNRRWLPNVGQLYAKLTRKEGAC